MPLGKNGTNTEPFFTTKPVGRGFGLGLSISKSIMDGFDGDIQAASELEKGSRFTVRLPIRVSIGVAPEKDAVSPSKDSGEKKRRVLLIDDDEAVLSTMSRMLERNFEVVTAGSGAAGQQILETDTELDVVVCDLIMPKISGMDLHEWLVSNNSTLASKMVFVTGGAFTQKSGDFINRTGTAVLEKPFDAALLLNAVQTALGTQCVPTE